jgi:hypothetical protein
MCVITSGKERVLWNPKVHCRIHKSPPLALFLAEVFGTHDFCKVCSSVVLPLTPCTFQVIASRRNFSSHPCILHVPFHLFEHPNGTCYYWRVLHSGVWHRVVEYRTTLRHISENDSHTLHITTVRAAYRTWNCQAAYTECSPVQNYKRKVNNPTVYSFMRGHGELETHDLCVMLLMCEEL